MPSPEEPPSYQLQKTTKEKIPVTWLAVTQDFFIPCLTSIAIFWAIANSFKQPSYTQVQDISNMPTEANMALAFTLGILTKIGLDTYWLTGSLKNQDLKLFDLYLRTLQHTNQVSAEQLNVLKYANIELLESGFADLIKILLKTKPLSNIPNIKMEVATMSQSDLTMLLDKAQKSFAIISKINCPNFKLQLYQERGKLLLQILIDLIESFKNKNTAKVKLTDHVHKLATIIEKESGNPYLVFVLSILAIFLNEQQLYIQTSHYVDHTFSTKGFHLKNQDGILDGVYDLKLINIKHNMIRRRRR